MVSIRKLPQESVQKPIQSKLHCYGGVLLCHFLPAKAMLNNVYQDKIERIWLTNLYVYSDVEYYYPN